MRSEPNYTLRQVRDCTVQELRSHIKFINIQFWCGLKSSVVCFGKGCFVLNNFVLVWSIWLGLVYEFVCGLVSSYVEF